MGKIDQLIEDIKTLKVQGATNVARASLDGMKIFVNEYEGTNLDEFLNELKTVSWKFASARPTEPLARNLVRFVLSKIEGEKEIDYIRNTALEDAIMEGYQLLDNARSKIIENGVELLSDVDALYTHCHSSTVEDIIKKLHDNIPALKVFASETRPLYQGRITVKNLLSAGIDTTMVVDSASSMFILSDRHPDVDAVVLGCDEIVSDGSFVNKIGTLDIALACQYGGKPLYVATTVLKLDPTTESQHSVIEYRSAQEIWEAAPEGLTIINPAFDIVPASLVTGYITEIGVLLPQELNRESMEYYKWLSS